MKGKTTNICIGESKCKTCGEVCKVMAHPSSWEPKPNTGYYAYWYLCENQQCTTTVFHGDDGFRHPNRKQQDRINFINKNLNAGTLVSKSESRSHGLVL